MSERIEAFVESMKIRPADRVLEIGCGHGVAATLICERLISGCYYAIDRSKKMVDIATKRNQPFVIAGLARFVHSEFELLDLGDLKFHKVLAMRVRLFREQPELATKLAERLLVPRGKLFVQYDEPPRR